jgi:hypothetical protein
LIDEHFRPIVAAFNDHKMELVKVKGLWGQRTPAMREARGPRETRSDDYAQRRTTHSFLRPTLAATLLRLPLITPSVGCGHVHRYILALAATCHLNR